MTVPYYPWTVWIWAGFDPVLIAVCLYMGWSADQFGKLFVAVIAGFVAAVLVSWAITAIGIPWVAPVSHDGPTFFPVRVGAAILWSILGFTARKILRPHAP